jgi:predicted nuclease of predicted toxin-antitoxin system
MNLLIDMNLSPQWCAVLGRHGHTCKHWSEAGDPRAPDATLLDWAREHGFVVVTHDLDFGAILAATRAEAPSVIQCRTQDLLPAAMEDLLVSAILRYESELLSGALIVLDKQKARARILPLGG